jgi:hypothetical protein
LQVAGSGGGGGLRGRLAQPALDGEDDGCPADHFVAGEDLLCCVSMVSLCVKVHVRRVVVGLGLGVTCWFKRRCDLRLPWGGWRRLCLGSHWFLCRRGFRCRGRLEVRLVRCLAMARAILRLLSSSRLMSFLVAILAVVVGDYRCWLDSGRQLV